MIPGGVKRPDPNLGVASMAAGGVRGGANVEGGGAPVQLDDEELEGGLC